VTATLQIVVDGPPKAKGRPRFGKGRVFTPKATVDAERGIGWHARVAMIGREIFDGPLAVQIHAWVKAPKKGKHTHPIVKPDADNLAKLVCDALNKIVWHDDKQIVDLQVIKNYSPDPRTVINVRYV
jgi:Holliday junction resolvase RusA-like endonuclease